MEKDKQLSQQQILLLDYNKHIDVIQKNLKSLLLKKQELLTKINLLSFDNICDDLDSEDNKLNNNLEEIKSKNSELQEKLNKLKTDVHFKNEQFNNVKRQIDKDFEAHVI